MFIKTIFRRKMLILLGLFFSFSVIAPGPTFGQEQEIIVPGVTPGHGHPPGIHQVFDRGFDLPVDSCKWGRFLAKVLFDPLPELLKPTHVRVKLKACYSSEKEVRTFVHGNFSSMDCSQTTMKILTSSISKGEVYEWDIVIVPRDIGLYKLHLNYAGSSFTCYFAFDESGKLVYLDKIYDPNFIPLPNHPAVNDTAIIICGGNANFSNVFRIVPPPSLNDTSIVYYKITAKKDYPKGVKVFQGPSKLWRGPIKAGDVYENSFKIGPTTVGRNGNAIFIVEAFSPKGRGGDVLAQFQLFYILDENGKLKFIAGYELKDETLLEKYK